MNSELLRLGLIVLVGFLVLYVYNNGASGLIKNAGLVTEQLTQESPVVEEGAQDEAMLEPAAPEHPTTEPVPAGDNGVANADGAPNGRVDDSLQLHQSVLPNPQMSNGNCFPQGQLSSKDLLPRETDDNTFAAANPSVPGQLSDKNFLESGHHFGINTVGNSLRNPNLQIRTDPLIPQKAVGPWMQSTITADTNRRPFEIGQ